MPAYLFRPRTPIIPPVVPGSYKFNPGGDWVSTPQYNPSTATIASHINAIAALGAATPAGGTTGSGITGYFASCNWSTIEGQTNNNSLTEAQNGTGQYAGFTRFYGNVFSYLQAKIPGAHFGMYDNTTILWLNPAPTGSVARSGSNGGQVPDYLLLCGGTISLPNSFGSSAHTTYTLSRQPNGNYGIGFSPYNNPNYGQAYPALWDPAVARARGNYFQALSNYKLPTATAYSSGTSYALGALVSSGGVIYCSTQDGNQGNAVTNTTFWIVTNNQWAGYTIDQCPLIEAILSNDELSYGFTGPGAPTGSTTANNPTTANFLTAFQSIITDMRNAFPHTMVGPCQSYTFTGPLDSMPASEYFNLFAYWTTLKGIVMQSADTYAGEWLPGFGFANSAKMAFMGVAANTGYSGGTIPAATLPPYDGADPCFGQVQPNDYGKTSGGGYKPLPPGVTTFSQSIVTSMLQAMAHMNVTHRIWSINDQNFNTTALASYMQPAFKAAPRASTTRPTNLP